MIFFMCVLLLITVLWVAWASASVDGLAPAEFRVGMGKRDMLCGGRVRGRRKMHPPGRPVQLPVGEHRLWRRWSGSSR